MYKPFESVSDEVELDSQDQGCLDAPTSVAPKRTPRSKALDDEESKDS